MTYYDAKLEEYETRMEELTEALDLNHKDKHYVEGLRQGYADARKDRDLEVERLRGWQKNAIDRIKVYIDICDHQRVTGEYMGADTCVYCALDRALIDAALAGENHE